MKSIFNSILSFEVFFKIFQHINDLINPEKYSNAGLHLTDVHYYFGHPDGGSPRNVLYGHFKMVATPQQVLSLKKEMLVIEPFGEATVAEKTEYIVVILSVASFCEKYAILFQEKGHLGAPTHNHKYVTLDIKNITNVILLLPMDRRVSGNGIKVLQTKYHFENLVYTKDGEIYFPYSQWEREVEDLRD